METRSSHPHGPLPRAPPPTGGEVTSGEERPRKLSRPPPVPEILHDGKLRGRALCALESRGSAVAREPAHLWRRRGLTLTGCGLALHPHRSGLTEPSLNWAGGWGGGVLRPGSQCRDGEVADNPRPRPKETGVPFGFLSFFSVAAVRSGDRTGAGGRVK